MATITSEYDSRNWLADRICVLPNAGERILDLGCGNGADTSWLIGDGYEVVSVDKDEACIAEVSKINPENSFVFDMTNADYWDYLPDNYFSAVIANHTLSKLKDETLCYVLGQIKRVLAPKGKLLARVSLAENAETGAMGEGVKEGLLINSQTGKAERCFSLGGAYSMFSKIGYVAVCPKEVVYNGKPKQIIEIFDQKEPKKDLLKSATTKQKEA